MANDRLLLRKRVVQFLELFRSSNDDWKSITVSHFVAEGRPRSTIYNIIDSYLRRGSVDHKKGAGRPARVMTPYNKRRLRRAVDHKTGVSQRRLAARFNCDQSYISKTLKNGYSNPILCRKRVKAPLYKSEMHYARRTLDFLDTNNIPYVPKDINPPNVPQCRPIEDFFGALATRVYEGNWVASNVGALERRIKSCISTFPVEIVQDMMRTTRSKLRRSYSEGIYSACH